MLFLGSFPHSLPSTSSIRTFQCAYAVYAVISEIPGNRHDLHRGFIFGPGGENQGGAAGEGQAVGLAMAVNALSVDT